MTEMQSIFAAEFKRLLTEKHLNKISVTELAERSHVSRQTFYYYFKDISEVASYLFTNDCRNACFDPADSGKSWLYSYRRMLQWLKENRLLCEEAPSWFLRNHIRPIVTDMIEDKKEHGSIADEQWEFTRYFAITGVTAVTIDWIVKGMEEDPDKFSNDVYTVAEASCQQGIIKFAEKNKEHGHE